VTNIWISKNKSNSQLTCYIYRTKLCCDKYLNFKEQKQFTTDVTFNSSTNRLWQISEFQRTKAIHNAATTRLRYDHAVTNIWISKNKSNSQHQRHYNRPWPGCDKYLNFKEQKQFTTSGCRKHNVAAVTNIWISKNKSNSQLSEFIKYVRRSCDKYLNFKEQKQFTTNSPKRLALWSCDKYLNFKEQKQFTTYYYG